MPKAELERNPIFLKKFENLIAFLSASAYTPRMASKTIRSHEVVALPKAIGIKVICTIESVSPLSWSRKHNIPKEKKESSAAHDKRTWRERLHYDEHGIAEIPGEAFKQCVVDAARLVQMKVPDHPRQTFTDRLRAGVVVLQALSLGIAREEVKGETLFVPSNGKHGGGARVDRCFPLIPRWGGKLPFGILDKTITPDVFEEHFNEAAILIGVGRFRPIKGGFYGRFRITDYEWSDLYSLEELLVKV